MNKNNQHPGNLWPKENSWLEIIIWSYGSTDVRKNSKLVIILTNRSESIMSRCHVTKSSREGVVGSGGNVRKEKAMTMVHFVSYFDVTQTFIVERHLHNDTTTSRHSSSLYKGCGSLETRITRHRMAGLLLMSDTSINVFMTIKSFSPNQNDHTHSFLSALQ